MCRMYFVATMMYYMLNTCKSMHLNKQPDIRKVTNYMTVQLQLVKTEMARLWVRVGNTEVFFLIA